MLAVLGVLGVLGVQDAHAQLVVGPLPKPTPAPRDTAGPDPAEAAARFLAFGTRPTLADRAEPPWWNQLAGRLTSALRRPEAAGAESAPLQAAAVGVLLGDGHARPAHTAPLAVWLGVRGDDTVPGPDAGGARAEALWQRTVPLGTTNTRVRVGLELAWAPRDQLPRRWVRLVYVFDPRGRVLALRAVVVRLPRPPRDVHAAALRSWRERDRRPLSPVLGPAVLQPGQQAWFRTRDGDALAQLGFAPPWAGGSGRRTATDAQRALIVFDRDGAPLGELIDLPHPGADRRRPLHRTGAASFAWRGEPGVLLLQAVSRQRAGMRHDAAVQAWWWDPGRLPRPIPLGLPDVRAEVGSWACNATTGRVGVRCRFQPEGASRGLGRREVLRVRAAGGWADPRGSATLRP